MDLAVNFSAQQLCLIRNIAGLLVPAILKSFGVVHPSWKNLAAKQSVVEKAVIVCLLQALS